VDEEEVVECAIAGCREAFDELVRSYRGQIYTLIRTLTGDERDADDLTQETFVRAYNAIGRFRRESAFRTWLTRIAVNAVRTFRADERRRPQGLRVELSSDAERSVAGALAASTDVETTLSRRQAIVRALAMLPDDWRVALTLKDVQGFEYHEIAAVLNVPIGTIESRVFRARRRLRPMLREWLHRAPPIGPGDHAVREDHADSLVYRNATTARR
jgi:RNA polymerase sigma-70 factor (ECF subfamily)